MCRSQMTPREQMADPEATLKSLRSALSDFDADYAQWWQYNVSHKYFMLRLYLSPPSEWLMIATIGTDHLSGPTHWNQPKFDICVEPHPKRKGQNVWRVNDATGGFSMTCSVLYWGRNVGWNDDSMWFSSHADPSGT